MEHQVVLYIEHLDKRHIESVLHSQVFFIQQGMAEPSVLKGRCPLFRGSVMYGSTVCPHREVCPLHSVFPLYIHNWLASVLLTL